MERNLFITADDFGLSREISEGIIMCAKEDLIDATALLVNAPDSDFAIAHLSELAQVEVGLHLSLVEGYSLTGNKSLLSQHSYFQGKPCLHANWKKFLKLYSTNRISLNELEEELEAQIERFHALVGEIPFLNSTQHLHVLPRVSNLIQKICKRHQIKKLRSPSVSLKEMNFTKKKIAGGLFLNSCSGLSKNGIKSLGKTYGISISGQIDEGFMEFVVKESRSKKIELVMHPGFDCKSLRNQIPENYEGFDWEKEIRSLRFLKELTDA
jgi:chitin disaccharide deacetylase